jgi:hypothetical protein
LQGRTGKERYPMKMHRQRHNLHVESSLTAGIYPVRPPCLTVEKAVVADEISPGAVYSLVAQDTRQ